MFNKKLTTLAVLCSLFTLPLAGQIALDNLNEIPRVKNGTTYIVMKDTAAAAAAPYKEIFRQYWTFSKIEFIQYKDILKFVAPDVSFFTIGGFTTTSTFVHMSSTGGRREGLSYDNTHLYLELWTCDPKELEKWQKKNKKKDDLPDKVKQVIGRIELFTDFPTLAQPDNIYKSDYDGDGHIRNWGPGYLKNYVQALMSLLEKGEKRWLYKGSSDPKQLKQLKQQVLYIPDYVLIKFNKFSGDESKKHEEQEIMAKYKYKYEIVSNTELNQKILDNSKPVFYLVYVKSSTDKYVSVYNSKTGDLIYTTYKPMSYNIKDDDLEDLSDAIKGK